MKKKIIIVIVLLLFAGIGWLGVHSIRSQQHNKETQERIKQLPEFSLTSLDGSEFTRDSLEKDVPVLIIHFSPDCDHCQYEAKEIGSNRNKLQHLEKLMVTRGSVGAVAAFRKEYSLDSVQRLHILMDKDNQLYKTFGLSGVPSFLIYSKDHQFVKKINGEVKIDYLLNQIPK